MSALRLPFATLLAALLSLATPVMLHAASGNLLQYSHSIDRIMLAQAPRFPGLTGIAPSQQLERPVALGGHQGTLYIADAGTNTLYRYDEFENRFTLLADVGNQLSGAVTGIHVHDDMTFFIADPAGQQVLEFDHNGHLRNRYRDPRNLSRPLAIAVNWLRNEVLIADGTFDRIVVFNRNAWPLYAIDASTQPGTGFKGIIDMAQAAAGLYVLNRFERQVQLLTLDGKLLERFATTEVTNPSAIAADRDGRVYIADQFDDTIKVYRNSTLTEEFGGTGQAVGRFRGITDLWVAGDRLYVADSLNGRIQVLLITPETTDSPRTP